MTSITLTYAERLSLYNQYEMLKSVHKSNVQYYDNLQTIVGQGYTSLYDTINMLVREQETPPEICKNVEEILWMFMVILNSCTEIPHIPTTNKYKFIGFDGNNESDYYAYAKFLREDLDRYTHVNDGDHNSHCEVLNRYNEMLDIFKSFGQPTTLTAAQIDKICA